MYASSIHKDVGFMRMEYPKISVPQSLPELPQDIYSERFAKIRGRMEVEGFSHLVVYGDREHFANLRFLSGYDPRFEEALLIISLDKTPVLAVGNEGLDYARIARGVDVVLFPHFSLQGQPENEGKSLQRIFADCGITKSSRVGLVGTKYIETGEIENVEFLSDIPAYIVDFLRDICGRAGVRDVTRWFTDPSEGFRISLTVHEIAAYEIANCYVYEAMRKALHGLKIGVSELEIASLLGYNGMFPLSLHMTVGFGKRGLMGLASPTNYRLRKGDFINFGFGVWGGNLARSGLAFGNPQEAAAEIPDLLDKLYIPYFLMLRRWYETIRVGITGGEVYDVVKDVMEDPFFGIVLNAGHQLRDEEWINTPFKPGSTHVLPSGTAIQCDIISVAAAPYYGIHTEDGLILANEGLRKELQDLYPETWQRIMARRKAMGELGYTIHDDVLPMSDMQGAVTPFLLDPGYALKYMG